MTPAANPRLFLFFTLLVCIVALGLVGFFVLPLLAAAAAMAVALYIVYSLYRFARTYIESTIESTDGGLSISIPGKDRIEIPYREVHLAGSFTIKNKPALFLYLKDGDRLYTIPREFSGFDAMRESARAHTSFEEVPVRGIEELRVKIKERFG